MGHAELRPSKMDADGVTGAARGQAEDTTGTSAGDLAVARRKNPKATKGTRRPVTVLPCPYEPQAMTEVVAPRDVIRCQSRAVRSEGSQLAAVLSPG